MRSRAAVLALVAAACDGSSAGTPDPARPAGDAASPDMGAAAPDTAAAAEVGPALRPGEVALGSIGLSQFPVPAATTGAGGFSIGPACPEQAMGDCTISDCTFMGRDVQAGDISILGGLEPVRLMNGLADVGRPVWRGGETLRFVVTGSAAGVPALDETLVAPPAAPVRFTFPALGTMTPVKRSQPLEVSWTAAGADGTVAINLVAPMGLRNVIAICSYPASSGAATLPTALLARFPAGDALVYAGALASRKVTRAPWVIDLTAFQVGVVGNRASFGMLRLE